MQLDIIHIIKPVICTYKTYTMKQYPVIHVLEADSHIQEATVLFKTSQKKSNTTNIFQVKGAQWDEEPKDSSC
jgi:hypothetical protein